MAIRFSGVIVLRFWWFGSVHLCPWLRVWFSCASFWAIRPDTSVIQ
jgi:hypothetical protein